MCDRDRSDRQPSRRVLSPKREGQSFVRAQSDEKIICSTRQRYLMVGPSPARRVGTRQLRIFSFFVFLKTLINRRAVKNDFSLTRLRGFRAALDTAAFRADVTV